MDSDTTQTLPTPPPPASPPAEVPGSEAEGFHSGEDFDSASEKPLVAGPDEQNLDSQGVKNPSLADKGGDLDGGNDEAPAKATTISDDGEKVPAENSFLSSNGEADNNHEVLGAAVEELPADTTALDGGSTKDVKKDEAGDMSSTEIPGDISDKENPSDSKPTEAADGGEVGGLEEKPEDAAAVTKVVDGDITEPVASESVKESSTELPEALQDAATLSHESESSPDGISGETETDETFVEAPSSLDPEADTVSGSEGIEADAPQELVTAVELESAPTGLEVKSDAPTSHVNADDGDRISATSVELMDSSEVIGATSEITTPADSDEVQMGEVKQVQQTSNATEQPISPLCNGGGHSVPASEQISSQANVEEVENGEEKQVQQFSSPMEQPISPTDNGTKHPLPASEEVPTPAVSEQLPSSAYNGTEQSISVSDENSNLENGVSHVVIDEGRMTSADDGRGEKDNWDDDNDDGDDQVEHIASEIHPRNETVGSSENAKQLLRDIEGSSAASSGVGSSMAFSNNVDGQIVSDSDEEVETDEEGEGKELFDSAALAALLRAATGGSGDGTFSISAPDPPRIFSVDRPAGLGSSMPSLKPGPARSARSNLFAPSDLTVAGEAENDMDEEEKKLHDKVEQIRVRFLRLVHRLGHSPEDSVAAQVLYRLGLAEGMKRGRQITRAFSMESARKKALHLEEEGQEDLEFFCNILVLGKSGVGKSATINSILGEQVVATNAFQPATTSIKEISGIVDGVKIRFIDTPGLKSSVMDQTSNRKILTSIKKYTKKCPPDIVLYIDRLDTQTRDFNDLPLFKTIASTLGSSIWLNVIVALTHGASAPPDGPNGTALSYDVFVAQRSHVVQHSIRQAAGDMRLMNPVALVENHPSCRRNREGQRVLPNGVSWRSQLLLLCYSSKILAEANALLKLQDSSPGKLYGFRVRAPPLPYLLSSLLQSRPHPKLSSDQGGDNGDSDIDLGDLSDADQEEEDDEYDRLPPFKPLKKAQIAMLTKEQKKAYYDEYDYRVKLLQKKQWKEELRRLKEMKKRGKQSQEEFVYNDMADDYDQDAAPAAVPVPLPDMVLPPSFDCENAAFRYRFLEPTSQILARPVLDTHGWDHDCGYDGVSLELNHAIAGQFPAGAAVQITKDKKEFNIHLDSSVAAKHGESGSTLAGFDVQNVGKQLAYILRSETKFKNLKKNKTAAGISVTFLGEHVATGLKVEDQLLIGKRICLVASTGAIRSQGDMAYGANLEAKLREKDFPIGQDVSTLGLSLMKWRNDLALGANLQSQFSIGRNSKVAVRVGLNNKLTGQITIRTSTSEQLQMAIIGVLPIAMSVFRIIWPGESYLSH